MATCTVDGKDISGGAIATNNSLNGADVGQLYFDTSINQLYICDGTSGPVPNNFMPVGSAANQNPGAAGSNLTLVKTLPALTDATFTNLCTVTVPNSVMGGSLRILASGTLGDGDSTQIAEFRGAISRIAGAATGVTFSAALNATTNNGVTANASLAIQSAGIVGANTATQTFIVQMKVTKSAGSSANHVLVATVELINAFASGITVA